MSDLNRSEAATLVTPKVLAAAWTAWHARHGGRLGPGPAFTEALTAGLAVALAERDGDLMAIRDRCAALVEKICDPPDRGMGLGDTENEIARQIRALPLRAPGPERSRPDVT